MIFCRFQNPSKKEFQYGAYIAPLADGLVFYVSYAPPLGKPAEGEEAWRRFRSALAEKP